LLVHALKECLFATEIKANNSHSHSKCQRRGETLESINKNQNRNEEACLKLWEVSVPKPYKENGQRRSDLHFSFVQIIIFLFLFLGMVMNDNKFKTRENKT